MGEFFDLGVKLKASAMLTTSCKLAGAGNEQERIFLLGARAGYPFIRLQGIKRGLSH